LIDTEGNLLLNQHEKQPHYPASEGEQHCLVFRQADKNVDAKTHIHEASEFGS
jgi:hypothetical protein